MASVLFTAGPSSADPVSGISTFSEDPFGSGISGTILPIAGVTSYRLATPTNHLTVVLEMRGPTAPPRTAFNSFTLNSEIGFVQSVATYAVIGPTTSSWTWTVLAGVGAVLSTGSPVQFDMDAPAVVSDFNCNCETVSPWDTLANVRKKMLIRLGYPNQLTTPPPGMAIFVDQFLRDAQSEIYLQLQRAALRTERFFKWTMVPGQRYYAFADEEVSCALLNPYKVTWVGFEDLNQAWYRLDEGIPPEYYTRANINFGWPTRFELRSCIEIFPAPQAAYTLWIKGDFGVQALVADADRFTIDDMAVYLLALGNAKAHYGQKDAQLVLTQAGNYSKALVAGTHGTKRYVPQSGTENPMTLPRFLPLGDAPP